MPDRDDRLRVRRRALANMVVGLAGQARESGGRLAILPGRSDEVTLGFADVRTLVRRVHGVLALERRHVVIVVGFPDDWPFVRDAVPQVLVLRPDDWAHPNSFAGRAICIDLAGVVPDRLPQTLYDVVRLRHHRLDHVADSGAAAFVRAHLADLPADPRPLLPTTGSDADLEPRVAASTLPAAIGAPPALLAGLATPLPAVDFVVGRLRVELPVVDAPMFLRLARPAGVPVDHARALYLHYARRQLRACTPGWRDGAGIAVARAGEDRPRLRFEITEVARGLEALADEGVARSYLELCPTPTQEGGANPCPPQP